MKKQLLSILLITALAFGTSAGPNSGTGTGSSWTTPTNVSTSNNSYATYSIGASANSTQLYISSLGFTIPSTATINGIVFSLERKCSVVSSCNTDTGSGGVVSLTKVAGTATGANKGNSTFFPTSDTQVDFGSTSDLWSLAWTATEINASGFGATITVRNEDSVPRTASIDYMAITVTYTAAASSTTRRRAIMVKQQQTRTARIVKKAA